MSKRLGLFQVLDVAFFIGRNRVKQLGQSKIEKLRMPVSGHHDVIGFNIPVDDVRLMGFAQTLSHLKSNLNRSD